MSPRNLLISLERKFPDLADVLARPEEWRELFHCDADSAVPHRFAAGPGKHPGDRGRAAPGPQILASLASIRRGSGMAVVSHYDIQPVIDIFGSVQGRDLGGVARDINKIVDCKARKSCRADRAS